MTLPLLHLFPRTPLKSNLVLQQCSTNHDKWPLSDFQRFRLNPRIVQRLYTSIRTDRFPSIAINAEIGSKYGPFDITKLPTWCDDTLPLIASSSTCVYPLPSNFVSRTVYRPERLNHTPFFLLTFRATTAEALRSHHWFALHFATFASSDVQAFGLITEHEQANSEMGGWVGKGQGATIAGDWWMGDVHHRRWRGRCRAHWRLGDGSVLARGLSDELCHPKE